MRNELDLLSGAEDIAAFMGIKPRRVYHLAENNQLPVFRLGATICARRSTIIRWIEEMEGVNGVVPEPGSMGQDGAFS